MSIVHRASDSASAPYAEEYPLPPPLQPTETVPQPENIQAGLIIIVGANVLVMAIVIVGMIYGGADAIHSVVAGVLYFALTSPVYVALVTGTLTTVLVHYDRQNSERQRVAAYLALGTMALRWRMEVERNRFVEAETIQPLPRPPAASVERVSPLTTFVAPYQDEQQAALEGVAWAEKLYDRSALGAPDPRKVHPDGRLKIRMLASKRGHGNREAGMFLIQRGVILRVAGGYQLNLQHYPYRHYVAALLRRVGVGVWGWGGSLVESGRVPVKSLANLQAR